MKNNLLGFGLSAVLHVTVVAQLLLPDSKPIVEPKEKVVPLSMAMFQEPVKQTIPVVEPPPPKIEKPIPKETVVKEPAVVPELVEKVIPIVKKAPPLPILKAVPKKVVKKPIEKKKVVEKKSVKKRIEKPKKKIVKKRIIKKKSLTQKRYEEELAKLLKPKKPVVKKQVQPNSGKRPPVRRPIANVKPTHQARRQNQVVRRPQPVKNVRKITKKPQVVITPKRPQQRTQAATNSPNSARFESAYKSRLRQLIESNKKYPRRAKRRGDQGVVKVSFVISANGQVSQIKVIQSSGSRILDEAAKNTIKKISGRIPFPKEIKKSQWKFTLPLTYRFRR